ncbi:hypothetical protein G6F50_015563 [Rhizopus delemar]|uniref:Uncharacterized protein n=1 Tax=Rhizopus delemar TaxID=936053 RepID=A0A9P6XX35_9FUNG|nr:hypothetical protein G6F50_015563 [Rhizopus delemar]
MHPATTQAPAPVHSAPGQQAASIAAAGQAGSRVDDSRCAHQAVAAAIARILTGIDLAAGPASAPTVRPMAIDSTAAPTPTSKVARPP